jgi:hypothetical protein
MDSAATDRYLTDGFTQRVGLDLALGGDGLPVDLVRPARIVTQEFDCLHASSTKLHSRRGQTL